MELKILYNQVTNIIKKLWSCKIQIRCLETFDNLYFHAKFERPNMKIMQNLNVIAWKLTELCKKKVKCNRPSDRPTDMCLYRAPMELKISNFSTNGPIFKCHTILETSACLLQHRNFTPWIPLTPTAGCAVGRIFQACLNHWIGDYQANNKILCFQ